MHSCLLILIFVLFSFCGKVIMDMYIYYCLTLNLIRCVNIFATVDSTNNISKYTSEWFIAMPYLTCLIFFAVKPNAKGNFYSDAILLFNILHKISYQMLFQDTKASSASVAPVSRVSEFAILLLLSSRIREQDSED